MHKYRCWLWADSRTKPSSITPHRPESWLCRLQYNGEDEAGGTVMTYERQGDKEILKAPGPLKESLHIMVSVVLVFNYCDG